MSDIHRVIAVTESSQTLAARIEARELAERIGLDDTDAHRAGLVATEMATNLVKHAPLGGEILIRRAGAQGTELEMLAIDRGPGMADLTASFSDGHSTAGSAGTGLGAIRRLSDEFDVFSRRPGGTVLFSKLRARTSRHASPQGFEVGLIAVAKAGEDVSGDGWHVAAGPAAVTMLLADGLGHGIGAADAANAAITAFRRFTNATPSEALEAVHDGVSHTRGAAAAVVSLTRSPALVRFAGIGNISGTITLNGTTRHVVSHNGTLGHEARIFREYAYPWAKDAIFVMHSDGLSSHWSLDSYPGLRMRHPSVIAAVLYRDFSRQRDDVTVMVAREIA
jgi:anti-sigma regulatory factor (Ser/Thr protein kinase)